MINELKCPKCGKTYIVTEDCYNIMDGENAICGLSIDLSEKNFQKKY